MPKRHELSLTTAETQELLRHRDHHQRPDVREKAAALLKIADGNSPHWVAKSGLLKPRDTDTVYGWLQIYLAEGFAGLIGRQHGGARRRFSDKKKRSSLNVYARVPVSRQEGRPWWMRLRLRRVVGRLGGFVRVLPG